jgi:hypothetical protein
MITLGEAPCDMEAFEIDFIREQLGSDPGPAVCFDATGGAVTLQRELAQRVVSTFAGVLDDTAGYQGLKTTILVFCSTFDLHAIGLIVTELGGAWRLIRDGEAEGLVKSGLACVSVWADRAGGSWARRYARLGVSESQLDELGILALRVRDTSGSDELAGRLLHEIQNRWRVRVEKIEQVASRDAPGT